MTTAHLANLAVTLARACLWLALLACIFVPVERLFAARPEKILRKAVATDLGYYFLASLLPALALSVPLAVLVSATHALLPAGIASAIVHWPLWLRALAALLLGEIGFYWGHRLSHEIPFLWRFHAIHHSAEHVDWLVNTRAHPIDMIFTRLCGLVPLAALGLASPLSGSSGPLPMLVVLLGTLWGFFIHANVRWRFGVLEWLVATPAFHHWHHTNDGPEVLDKNFAPLLPGIDWLFGTLHLPVRARPARYGVDTPVPASLLGQLLTPLGFSMPRPPRTDGGQRLAGH